MEQPPSFDIDASIVNHLKTEKESHLYSILKIIVRLKHELEHNPSQFDSVIRCRDALISILEECDISQRYVDDRVKKINFKNGIRIISFDGQIEDMYENAVLCQFLKGTFSETLFQKYKIIVTGITYAVDSHGILTIGIAQSAKKDSDSDEEDDDDGDWFELIMNTTEKVEKYIRAALPPNGGIIYGD